MVNAYFFALRECTVKPRRYVCMVKVVRLLRYKYQLSCLLRHKLLVLKMTEQKVLQQKSLVLNLEVEDSLVNNSIPTTSRKHSLPIFTCTRLVPLRPYVNGWGSGDREFPWFCLIPVNCRGSS